jgi:uncharacterized membrane protein
MSLAFRNNTPEPLWLVIAYSDSDCTADGGAGWMKEGWWEVPPNGSATVRGGPVNGAKYFFYAEGGSGRVWQGDFGTSVPLDPFTQCWGIGSTDSQGVSMRKIEVPVSSFNHTINLS